MGRRRGTNGGADVWRRLRAACGLALSLVLGAPHLARADDAEGRSREAQLRAAYLVSIAKFVEWQAPSSSDEFTVCFDGAADVRDALKSTTAGKRISGQAIAVRDVSNAQDLAGCRVLYLEARATSRISLPLEGPHGQPAAVLTVSDAKNFAEHEGVVELFAEKNRLRFSVNVINAKRAGLRLRSELLELASHVVKEGS